MNLTAELQKARDEIEQFAHHFGLDFYYVIFEMLKYNQVNEVAAKGGFPIRYPHWRFGMEYDQLRKGYNYGLQKIYEMVINNDPCYAYLMESNNLVDQKLVMAHVYAHCDFFKNNYYFSKTNRKMIDEMANHATLVRRYIDRYGLETVETFIDRCLTLENLIDYNAPFIKRKHDVDAAPEGRKASLKKQPPKKLKSKAYMDSYINPPDFLEEQHRKKEREVHKSKAFPAEPEQDILNFLLLHAPMEEWEHDILSIIREEAYYFAPQGQTKIMNEGWASYWHSKIMTTKVLKDHELIDYADHHSGTVHMSPGQLNPYKIGIELYRDIEDRWNKGKFGKEYDECEDYNEKKHWDKKMGLGRDKIFEVRKIYNDLTFIDTFLSEEFCKDHNLFAYRFNPETNRYEITSRDFRVIKNQMLFSLTNLGQPMIRVVDANYENRGELFLVHDTDTIGLDLEKARETLESLQHIWKRPVQIQTRLNEDRLLLKYDGREHQTKKIDAV